MLVGLPFGSTHCFLEFLFQESLTVFESSHLTLKDLVGSSLGVIDSFQQAIEVFVCNRCLLLRMKHYLPSYNIDGEI